ncbi:AAA family ATPase, partial [Acidiphilium sp.]|uniref:AAA family ATPase n=1 Tax=Acidiphilium sp. TaxID=527 RepID=UPI003D07A80A
AHVGAQTAAPQAHAQLDAAIALLAPPARLVVAIGGLPGSGKSTLARRLAPKLRAAAGALIIRSDELRKRLCAAPPEQRLGPSGYTREANDAVDHGLITMLTAALPDYPVIIDATCQSAAFRDSLAVAAQRAGVPLFGVWLEAPLTVLERRIGARSGDASDATIAILHEAAGRASRPDAPWISIDAATPDGGLAALMNALADHLPCVMAADW